MCTKNENEDDAFEWFNNMNDQLEGPRLHYLIIFETHVLIKNP